MSSTTPIDVHNPATGATIASVAVADHDAVDRAVRLAAAAQSGWHAAGVAVRAATLRRIADAIAAAHEALAALETTENGKPLDQARNDVGACIGSFRFFADAIEALPEDRRVGLPVDVRVHLEPYGVVGGIIPFNWPPIHFAAKVAPALAVGNAVVLKPAEQAPLTVLRLANILAPLLPEGLLQVVTGDGTTGAALAAHPLIRKLSFTGAPSTGARVLATVAPNLTPTLMELGGKNPFVIFADADLDRAIPDAIEGAFYNKGEACTAASRILVERAIHDRVCDRLARAVAGLVSGDGARPGIQVGPLVSAAQRDKVAAYIAAGIAEGATIAAQGRLPDDPACAAGFFIRPTLFTNVAPSMALAREEIFGPVTVLIPFDDEAQAVAIANDTDFGLTCAIYTSDPERAERVARAVEAGVVFVNNYWRIFLGTPFGGTKASGYGREHAAETLKEFGYLKQVRTAGAAPLARWFDEARA